MSEQFLSVAETFYSIQGEGPYCGVPAVFLRLGGCNLSCSGFSYRDPETDRHWGCDTGAVWRQAQRYSFEALFRHWEERGWLAPLRASAHLVITGGEPGLHQEQLIQFLHFLRSRSIVPWVELETNATLVLQPAFRDLLQHINASPKLRHSGEARARAYRPEVLAEFAADAAVIFKFVVATADDVVEIQRDYVEPFGLSAERIFLMPEGGNLETLRLRQDVVVALCQETGYRFSPRLHIYLWDTACGV